MAESKKKVLVVSYTFPPENNMGAVRIGKFVKYLPEFGWEPVVLTADRIDDLSRTLPVEIDEANIFRTKYFTLSHILAGMLTTRKKNDSINSIKQDSYSNKPSTGWKNNTLKALRIMSPVYSLPMINQLTMEPLDWYRSGLKQGMELAKKGDIDVIFSSYSPSTSHLVASGIQKRTGIPWVADFRDLWSLNPYSSKLQPFHFLEKKWEKRAMRNSALLVTVSEPIARELEEFHSKKVVTIPNGFDEADYIVDDTLLHRFTITYTGTIYPGKRDPSPLFRAIAELSHEGRLHNNAIEVRFFGLNVLETIRSLVNKYGVKQFVKVYGFVPFKESILRQKESTVLLLLSWNAPKDKGVYTGKVFEYLGASRPILGIGLKVSVIDELLANTGAGIIADEVGEIKAILLKWFEEFSRDGEITSCYHPNGEVIKRFTRREHARKLAEVFNSIIA